MMLLSSDRMMLTRLLRLLVLCSLCSPGLTHHHEYHVSEEGSTFDFKHSHELGSTEDGSADWEIPGRPRSPMMPSYNDSDHDMGGMNAPQTLCDRIMNVPVPPHPSQIPFFCVCRYCKGHVGPKGNRGDRGRPGLSGSPGPRGLVGFKGQRGFIGPQGIKGQKGDQGEKGRLGENGLIGQKGMRGFKGEKGDQGSMGVPGAQGPQGVLGICPESCRNFPGDPGQQGPPGHAGGRGLPGIKGLMGSKGMKGAKGDLGRTGDPGMDGEKGDRGDQGVCECTDGMDGTDGQPGMKGDKGDKGTTGVQGVQGNTGVKGNKGDLGLMGPIGSCTPAIRSAFSASINESFPKELKPIPFHSVLSNLQNHFNASSGMYTAPVNGTYVFSFHLTVAVKPLKIALFVGRQPVFKITEVHNPTTTSHEVVLHLTAGDEVYLLARDSQTNGLYHGPESTSTFSGYLLYPDSCELPTGRDYAHRPPPFGSGNFTWDGPKPIKTTPAK
ncbi:unnamed protein product [Ophioblennius macclurei]